MITEWTPRLADGILPGRPREEPGVMVWVGAALSPTLSDPAPVSSVSKKGWFLMSGNSEEGLIRKVVKFSILKSVQ